jgi:hypothetical protein
MLYHAIVHCFIWHLVLWYCIVDILRNNDDDRALEVTTIAESSVDWCLKASPSIPLSSDITIRAENAAGIKHIIHDIFLSTPSFLLKRINE